MNKDDTLREHLVELLKGGSAHLGFESVLRSFPLHLCGKKPKGLTHSPWELLEHIRIAQWDILEYCMNPHHESPTWPDEYWPDSAEPPDEQAWEKSVQQVLNDRDAMIQIIQNSSTDLLKPFSQSNSHTICREALLLADHNAYHLGQMVLTQKLINAF